MRTELSRNGKAILLLTAPLLAGKSKRSTKPLSLGEYNKLARHLHFLKKEPADLFQPNELGEFSESAPTVDLEHVKRLLKRGLLLAQAMNHWAARNIWVVTRADPEYPRRLKNHLRSKAPPVLYGCGDGSRIEDGGLAVVGSRRINDSLIAYSEQVGKLAAEAHVTIVSGGAKGVDQAAMRGALDNGGPAIGVLSNNLERTALNGDNRQLLIDGRLTLISQFDPSAGFRGWMAMQRNKLIYALADAALVVNSDLKGGTWEGATEQLRKLHFVPVYARKSNRHNDGLSALLAEGAKPWPSPETPAELVEIIDKSYEPGPHKSTTINAQKVADELSPGSQLHTVVQRELWDSKYSQADDYSKPDFDHDEQEPVPDTVPQSDQPNVDVFIVAAMRLLQVITSEMSRKEIRDAMELKDWGNINRRYVSPCLEKGWIELAIPGAPSSRNQRFRLTPSGEERVKTFSKA